ncbi:hypothetical protein AX769_02195 [Frondihabitans sp. PAMC 28766]|uniref:WXG100 family type VII secretion target n=1 Tax=Frondihabitans sp. PAMC 28766 TaxID=1795630 RepID=UPI00078D7549|nr:WXG100 family type VII secretion target [Frondihabitans sp. PAMC 28766]AMM19155.1 hypothetical protein AX769_02195 [Frondihabitans sp. PAMC 28766]
MSRFTVSSEAIQGAAATVSGRVAEFEARVSALNNLVTATIGSTWSGAGADAFSSDYVEWFDGAHEVHAALARVASLLANSAETYQTTESSVTDASQHSHVVNDFTVAGD